MANLKFDLPSESYRSILAIMHFCDAFYSQDLDYTPGSHATPLADGLEGLEPRKGSNKL